MDSDNPLRESMNVNRNVADHLFFNMSSNVAVLFIWNSKPDCHST